jgi:predicted esterase
LLVALLGYDDDPAALLRTLRALDPEHRCAIVAPAGPTMTESDGPAWFPSSPGDEGPTFVEALDDLRSAASGLIRAFDDVVAFGYSQGAATALALALGATTGWRPGVVVALAAWLPNEPGLEWDLDAAARAGLRVLLVHGTHDEVVPVEQGRSIERLLTRRGIDVTWHEIDAGHAIEPLAEATRGWLGLGSSAPP